jgi:peptide subunit release factor RF-3
MLLQSLWPIGEENDFKGIVDLVKTTSYCMA